MRRISTPTAAQDLFGPGKHGFRNGDPANAILATRLQAEWFNALQEEVAGLVEQAGIVLDPEDSTQLLKALRRHRGGAGTGFGLWKWSSATAGDPGVGKVALNNVDPALATQLLLAEVSDEALDYSMVLATARAGDTLYLQQRDNAALGHRFKVTGAPTDIDGYRSIPLAYIGGSGGVPAANVVMVVHFSQTSTQDIDPWEGQPLGVPVPVFTHIAGVSAPPTDKAYRYIKLTASDAYNAGVLISESVTGSAPLVAATAVINLAGSPLNGQTISLINTEKRVLRASVVSGELLNDAFQGHWHKGYAGGSAGLNFGSSSSAVGETPIDPFRPIREAITDGVNGTPRTANETRPKSIGTTYYMRIK
ncbi:hypothetical protein CK486_08650 [Pseudomonas sp. HAR-UPW-AIA-41]|uniref:hypothetical protein n=1 Tax=Pseudomonas sp. HAR-UPW-AIA-41 TaxID=1985301 RepID=UPI000BB2FA75|nr:hypothetical protein [Pseudomonas sp. HAR-UPW-AIA-41]PAV48508.1 hypothetical protein CK486_08650 [Pseudomonas sp. HAR-UPW-AIA-41]